MQRSNPKNDKQRIRKLLAQPRWKIVVFTLALNALILWQTAIDYYFYLNFNFLFARRTFIKRTNQQAHWVGAQISKPHRLASFALVIVLIAGIFNAPHTQAALTWSLGWGTIFSLFVIYRSTVAIVQRIHIQTTLMQHHQRPQN